MKKNTKKSLLFSVLALVLCCAMLIGTTLAWFTDSASTAVNKIEAGTLDVALLDAAGQSLEGKTLKWQKPAGHENENVLWEPGCTYNLQPITIKNNGNLALKYKLVLTGIKGDVELNDVIAWTINGSALDQENHLAAQQSVTLTISGTMSTDANNQYQGKSIEGISINVVATQDTVESDSTGNTYDQLAEYDTAIVTAAELKAAMTPDANGVITLTKDYILTNAWESLKFTNSITIEGNGHTIRNLNQPLLAGNAASTVTIKDLTIANSAIGIAANENGLGTGAFISFMDATTSATFENCHLIDSSVTGNERAAGLIAYSSSATITVTNCTVENCVIKAVGGTGGLIGYSQSTTTITDSSVSQTSVTSTEDRLGTKTPLAGGVIGTVGGATTFTNVTATDVMVSNNNAGSAVYNDLVGRIAGGSIN